MPFPFLVVSRSLYVLSLEGGLDFFDGGSGGLQEKKMEAANLLKD